MTHESIEDIPADEFEHTLRSNLFGTFFRHESGINPS